MKPLLAVITAALVAAGCAANDAVDRAEPAADATTVTGSPSSVDPTVTGPASTPAAERAVDRPDDRAVAPPEVVDEPIPTPIVEWERTDLSEHTGELAHVTDLLWTSDERLVVGFYPETGPAGIAVTDPAGGGWSVTSLPGATQLRDLVELPDGAVLATGTAEPGSAILWREDGDGWTSVGEPDLPTDRAANGWDLEVLDDGSVLLATDALANDPTRAHPSLHRSVDGGRTWTSLAPLPGLGVLALTAPREGLLLAATEDSSEHDDADEAGQARVYASTDGGSSWAEPVELPGANRVYDLTTLGDGTVWAATGIRGEILESDDDGRSWTPVAHVPSGRPAWEGGTAADDVVDATRVYRILELTDGRIVVGTGNSNGDVFISGDRGDSWESLPETGPNNVVWGLAQSPDGGLWVGTGSRVGDLLVASTG